MESQTLSSNVNWIQFPGFPGLYYNVLDVDPDDRFVQLLMKFEAGVKCIPHRHIGPVQTLVLEGEHQIFAIDDPSEPTDRRVAGTYSTHTGDE
ncbi:MAG: cupin domain-containing protein, partial [Acidimicrobiales bacterium]